jgi:LysM repeat protein
VAHAGQLAEPAEMSNRVKASYAVKRGDTLASIARLYSTTVASIRNWNPRLSGGQLAAGQRLTIYRLAN